MRWTPLLRFTPLQLKPPGPLQPTSTIDNHRETILLYRALLRQCTYLPDPAARKYTWTHIAERFHAYHPRTVRYPNGMIVYRAPKSISKERISEKLQEARKSLKYLQRANDGHIQHLRKVLDMTYGRTGKRRRELIYKLQVPSAALTDNKFAVTLQSHQQLSAELPPTTTKQSHQKLSSELPPTTTKPNPPLPCLTDEALALLKSQTKQDSSRFDRAPLKASSPKIPLLNSWKRKLPEKRRVNLVKKWYAMTLDRLMPPLEPAEWERLKNLATGATRWEGMVVRRKMGGIRTSLKGGEEEKSKDERFAIGGLRHRLTSSTERVVQQDRHPEVRTNPHVFTGRFMRGMWASVFKKCPRLDWNLERRRWDVTWGNVGKAGPLVLSGQKETTVEMFEGVDDSGRVVVSPMGS
ncbi:MAG: hypothetical protein Q9220_003800 [cf. Caloplaca sp. 1 TL-2023]